ncbi:hypothetical protein RRG08_031630 [Elysia crispata]|uniref:Reverse transcriptase domain-containing protein n=1 Tax=Elysia crispata TaxID=231223 RepID=A0AAE1DVV0_9GAST|nr:hypothetical protein RRG08_031630 [Elysia crispata]
MNSIQNIIKPHVKAALYADDLALICSEDSCGTAQVRLQECLTLLEQWTEDWAMSVNAAKTTYSIFSLSTKIPNLRLKINNTLLERENHPKYLGVTFDPRLTWCKQTENVQKDGIRRTSLLKKLAGTSWGADMKVLKKTYVGYVRPVIEYGMASWGTAAKTNFQKIERVQNQSLRILTGGMKSTPMNYMEAVACLEPLEDRKMRKTLTQYTKFQHLTSHPMHKLTASKTKKRLKRTNFTASALQIHKRLALPDLKPDAPLQTSTDWPPWSQQSHPEIAKDIGGISTKRSMLKEKYPSDHWIRAFRWISLRSNTRWKREYKVPRTQRPNPSHHGTQLYSEQSCPAMDSWIFGNDIADELAEEGGLMKQIQYSSSYKEAKTLINSAINYRWNEGHPQYKPGIQYISFQGPIRWQSLG